MSLERRAGRPNPAELGLAGMSAEGVLTQWVGKIAAHPGMQPEDPDAQPRDSFLTGERKGSVHTFLNMQTDNGVIKAVHQRTTRKRLGKQNVRESLNILRIVPSTAGRVGERLVEAKVIVEYDLVGKEKIFTQATTFLDLDETQIPEPQLPFSEQLDLAFPELTLHES